MGDRATEVALFHYALIRDAADAGVSKAERGRLVRALAAQDHIDKVQARLATIAAKRRVGHYLQSTVGVDTANTPTLRWSFDQAALHAGAATDDLYCLLTNLDPDEVTAGEVLARYKGQEVIERRYGNFKGPLAVAPVFLKNNRRIGALLTVICLAPLIFCLVERDARRAIAPERKIADLDGYRDARPTGRNLFNALGELRLIPATAEAPPIVPAPTGLQAGILDLLNATGSPPADTPKEPTHEHATATHMRNTGLVAIRVPSPVEEAVRDLCRTRVTWSRTSPGPGTG